MNKEELFQKIEKFVQELKKDPRVKGFQYSCKHQGGCFGGSWDKTKHLCPNCEETEVIYKGEWCDDCDEVKKGDPVM